MSNHFRDSNIRGLSGRAVKKVALEKIWANLPNKKLERKAMASPPTITQSSTATLARLWPSNSFVGDAYGLSGSPFNYIKAGNYGALGAATNFIAAVNIKRNDSTYSSSNLGVVFWHRGQDVEFKLNGLVGYFMIKVDDEYVSLTAATLAYSTSFVKVAFGSVAKRKIELIIRSDAGFFGGVNTAGTDTLEWAEVNGPKAVIIGDSFIGGIGTSVGVGSLGAIPALFADYIGWDNVLYDAIGGTGYLAKNSGLNYNYRERVQHNVIDQAPDVVIVTGGYNDRLETPANVYAEASLYFSEIRRGLPDALVIIYSPFWYRDITTYTGSGVDIIATRNAIKQAAEEHGFLFIDILELTTPIDKPAGSRSGVLKLNTTAGATTFYSDTFFPVESAVQIGQDRCVIGSVSGTGSYAYSVKWGSLTNAHAIGTTMVSVGRGFWTGIGSVAAPTGSGNCDLFVASATDIHPTDAGHGAIASLMVQSLTANL